MVIKWTPLARKSLKDIYNFYQPDTGRTKALEIVQRIKDETNYLLTFPEMGMREKLDGKLSKYRSIVKDHCKIYYTIEKKHIRIALVWDTRRNPESLRYLL
ncbi:MULTISPECIES: type II toxin-antitoxin system RelE/ParE family toxin [Parabacteroides]|uniref:type II toxin-antitoxin system RelE/ParE family toxin n=1 Tax=Parabacteroides TaxID=375288 RepID=UPI000F0031F1|nr:MULTISPECIES: type II toxin-antitoxin system RelE/ParE family toxin [Parabacteroides]MBC8617832.1 type II toxin-antitoxin system RelE/ParE family toxin [Parabacteroides faecis]RHR93778.1 type II toxin-antitoxin system RelE/ParE family toxin [Parabacteroides sp. AF14-59]